MSGAIPLLPYASEIKHTFTFLYKMEGLVFLIPACVLCKVLTEFKSIQKKCGCIGVVLRLYSTGIGFVSL